MFRFASVVMFIILAAVGGSSSAFAQTESSVTSGITFDGSEIHEEWTSLQSNQALRVSTPLGEQIFIGEGFKIIMIVGSDTDYIITDSESWTKVMANQAIMITWPDHTYMIFGDGKTVKYMIHSSEPMTDPDLFWFNFS